MAYNDVYKQYAWQAFSNQYATNMKDLFAGFLTEPQIELSEDEKFQVVTQRILKEHMAAFEELAK